MTEDEDSEARGLSAGAVVGDIGLMLHLPGLLAVAALPVAMLAGEWFAVPGFVALAVAAPLLGQLLMRRSGSPGPTKPIDTLAAVAVGWLLCAVLAAVPLSRQRAGDRRAG